MMLRNIAIPALIALGLIAYGSTFEVTERDRALVQRFGEIKRVVNEPGLYFKLPFVDTVTPIDKRLVLLENENSSVQVIDSRRYLVDAITMYKVSDLQRFREAVQANFNVSDAQIRSRVDAALRETYGKSTFQAALSDERQGMMRGIRDQVRTETKDLGVDIVDVRIMRTDLPQDVLEQTYQRMQAERKAEAEQIRAVGNQQALTLKAQADRDYTVTLAESQRDAEVVRGQGEAERNRIFAQVYEKDPDFFVFYRTMRAYAQSLKGNGTTYVLRPDSEFFKYFNSGSVAAPKSGK